MLRIITTGAVSAALILAATGCTAGGDDTLPVPSRPAVSATVDSVAPDTTATPIAVATAPAVDHGPAPAATGEADGGDGSYRYVVAPGDGIAGIAGRFGLCIADLYRLNPGTQGHEIMVGQTLVVERTDGPGHAMDECEDQNVAGVDG
ncbi:LysM peptidoglycan-binding domain-containing protein [Curtobacterium sp. SP.BCo]|uniref:LysM peptidoglycan-binding domain-containing protein n=1 Tax=Curtobacterium sp. SP.BCo TaxID=3435229 RepID=UPI003F73DF64